jgi:hypothetical protein
MTLANQAALHSGVAYVMDARVAAAGNIRRAPMTKSMAPAVAHKVAGGVRLTPEGVPGNTAGVCGTPSTVRAAPAIVFSTPRGAGGLWVRAAGTWGAL